MEQFHGTTILTVRRGNVVALGGDGQVTLGNIVMKGTARKVRKLYHNKVLAGFAGGTADAFTLIERFESKLEKHQGHLMRASVELAKDWRTDRMLRRLEAMLLVADKDTTLVITGNEETDLVVNTQNFTNFTEQIVREHPEQWVWMHERWKTKPGEEIV